MNIKLTVLFQDPFWVGIFERTMENTYEVARIVFGVEPKDYEVYEFILKNFYEIPFSCPLKIEEQKVERINPKRLQRIIKRQTESQGMGTKAQEAIKLQQESMKQERKIFSKEKKEEEKQKKFELRQQKKKEKKKGH